MTLPLILWFSSLRLFSIVTLNYSVPREERIFEISFLLFSFQQIFLWRFFWKFIEILQSLATYMIHIDFPFVHKFH
jgi:hypothetical protein